jgi:hypothetical protein
MKTTFERKNNITITATEAPAALSEAVETRISHEIEAVKRQVFTEYQGALENNEQLLRLALIEAESVARQTEYPHLVFPLLATEKAQKAARWKFHQKYLLRDNPSYAFAA